MRYEPLDLNTLITCDAWVLTHLSSGRCCYSRNSTYIHEFIQCYGSVVVAFVLLEFLVAQLIILTTYKSFAVAIKWMKNKDNTIYLC